MFLIPNVRNALTAARSALNCRQRTMTTIADDGLWVVLSESSEWGILWDRLAGLKINKGLADPKVAYNAGEYWMYMNTVVKKRFFLTERYYHVFKHRLHPRSNGREFLTIAASKSFDPLTLVNTFTR